VTSSFKTNFVGTNPFCQDITGTSFRQWMFLLFSRNSLFSMPLDAGLGKDPPNRPFPAGFGILSGFFFPQFFHTRMPKEGIRPFHQNVDNLIFFHTSL